MFERFTNRARSVLVTAQDEARGLGHDFIGTEHLVLGIVAANDPVVTPALQGYDFTLEQIRGEIADVIGPSGHALQGAPPFTPRAKKVLELSLREALSMGHDHIGVAHILLGILREGEGVGAQVLVKHGVDYDRVRLWIGTQVGERTEVKGRRGRRRRFFETEQAPSAMTTPMNVATLAMRQHEGFVGTHHMLLALLQQERSMAAQALAAFGVTAEQVEAKIAEIGVENTSDAPPRPPIKPTTVSLSEGVEVRISDPDLTKLVETGQLEELLKEIVRRSKPA